MTEKGFHFIEILCGLFIIGLVFTQASYFYTSEIVTAKRHHAQMVIIQLAAALEEYYLQNNTYEGFSLDEVQASYQTKNYEIKLTQATSDSYEVVAIPRYSQAINDQRCGTLLFTSKGEKTVSGAGPLEACW